MAKQTDRARELLELITLDEAAKLRGVTRPAISYLVNNGRIRSQKLFGRVLVYRDEVLKFKKEKPGPKVAAKKRGAKR